MVADTDTGKIALMTGKCELLKRGTGLQRLQPVRETFEVKNSPITEFVLLRSCSHANPCHKNVFEVIFFNLREEPLKADYPFPGSES
jgi:hypothetical protein